MKPIITLLLLMGSFYSFSQVGTGTLWLTVKDYDSDTLLKFTTISINLKNEVNTVVTDSLGIYRVKGLTPNTYTIKASCDGYENITIKGLYISAGKITLQDLSFSEKPKDEPIKRPKKKKRN